VSDEKTIIWDQQMAAEAYFEEKKALEATSVRA